MRGCAPCDARPGSRGRSPPLGRRGVAARAAARLRRARRPGRSWAPGPSRPRRPAPRSPARRRARPAARRPPRAPDAERRGEVVDEQQPRLARDPVRERDQRALGVGQLAPVLARAFARSDIGERSLGARVGAAPAMRCPSSGRAMPVSTGTSRCGAVRSTSPISSLSNRERRRSDMRQTSSPANSTLPRSGRCIPAATRNSEVLPWARSREHRHAFLRPQVERDVRQHPARRAAARAESSTTLPAATGSDSITAWAPAYARTRLDAPALVLAAPGTCARPAAT